MIDSVYQDRISQIVKIAQESNHIVSQQIAFDILQDKDNHLTVEEFEQASNDLRAKGVQITSFETSEDYPDDPSSAPTFIPADVHIQTRSVNVDAILDRLNYNEIDLKPLFQRQGNLWSMQQQSRLIESLMLKIPLPAFYFDAADESSWVVIDGLQRLTAFQNYLMPSEKDNDPSKTPPYRLEGLQYLTQFNGKTFSELPRQYIRRIKESQLVLYLVERGTPDEIVRNIFQRINTGGLTLSEQEIRQALYEGDGTKLTEELAKSESFLNATQNAVETDRMTDREYINRYLAFTLFDYEKCYNGNIDSFLSYALKELKKCSPGRLDQIRSDFCHTMDLCAFLFGKYAFRTQNKDWRRGRLNKALFEVCSVCFSHLSVEKESILRAHSSDFLKRFHDLLQKDEYRNALRGGDSSAVRRRINMTQEFLEAFICSNE